MTDPCSSGRALRLAALVVIGLASTGCAILELGSGGTTGGDATLTQAAHAAADTSRKQKSEPALDVGHQTPPVVATEVEVGATSESLAPAAQSATPPPPSPPDPFQRPVFGLVVEMGSMGGEVYDGFGSLGLGIGGYPADRLRVDLFGRIGGVNFKGESLQGQALVDEVEAMLDLMLRYELTRGWTFLSLYPVAGLGTGTLFWDSATPVPAYENGVPVLIEDDQLNYFYAHAGFGFAGMRTKHVLLDVIGMGGVRWYGWHTKRGFDNDLLPAAGYARLQFELAFR